VTLGASNRVIAYFRSKFKTVAAGAYHTCALRPAGNVVCWGLNYDSQLGTGNINLSMGPVQNITNAIAIAAGGYHTCALIVDGTVQCWGNNNFGQVGVETFGADVDPPITVGGITEALAVTAGGYHTCVVKAGGSASCWGYNADGQLGANARIDHTPTPVTVPTTGLTRMIAAGGFHTCAIVAADSTVTCWGRNSDGQLGVGDAPAEQKVLIAPPDCAGGGCIIAPATPLTATTIAASIGVGQVPAPWPAVPLGGYHSAAVDSTGQHWGWGNNNDGQVSGPPFSSKPMAVKSSALLNDPVLKIAAGAYHTCVAKMDTVFCIGNNDHKQSGNFPGAGISATPTADLAAGGYHTCAVVLPITPTGGAVLCWGLNHDGEVTGASGPDVTTPFKVDP
jgi:alpha-tubulin suppressor-like RCC1 family protein